MDLLGSFLQTKSLKAGEFLLYEGEICRYQSFVLKGCLKSYYTDDTGAEHIIDFLVEEWWAEDLYSLLTQTAARTSIRAIENSELVRISRSDMELLYTKIPSLERFFRILFQQAYISQREQINQSLAASAEERYLSFLKKKPYAEKRFSQKDIASYLGVTPQFFSLLKKKISGVNAD